jgi:HlyD family secretion protein
MSAPTQKIFRAAALERLSSPDQLDHLVEVARPADWVAVLVICLGLGAVIGWSVIGKIPTRVAGEGILIGDGGRVIDAVSAVTGRLASIDIAVDDRVTQGQIIATIAQTDTELKYRNAADVVREREHEHGELVAAVDRELAIKAANFKAQEAGLKQAIAAAERRAGYLTEHVAGLTALNEKGFVTRRELEDRRAELSAVQQRTTDAQNQIQQLVAEKSDIEAQRERERLASEFQVNEARRQLQQLAGLLERDSRLVSPIDGRVIEVKVSPGSVLTVGMPVIEIEIEGRTLAALVYIPADLGKSVKPGMEARVEPATVKREEFGTMIGKVATVSEFPMTPQGMSAVLHNDALVTRFSRDGTPFAALVQLQPDTAAASGYRWSSGSGPPIGLSPGTLARIEITTREQPPIDLVLPSIRRASGIGR